MAVVGVVVLLALWCWDRRRVRSVSPVSARPVRLVVLIVQSLVGVLVATQLLLFAPMVDNPTCARPVRLGHGRAYPLNCDSPLFMQLAHDPGRLLQPRNPRQSRPGYVTLAALTTRVVGPTARAAGLDRAFGQSDTAYVPLILINLVIVAAAVVLLAWLLSRLGTPPGVTAALCVLLVVNDLTKAFFWTPHQQMFALLVPVATISVARWVLRARPSRLVTGMLGIALGLASFIYANVLITAMVVGLVLLARGWRGAGPAAALCVSFAAPPVGWIAYCKVFVGSYFSLETKSYREFIWLPEAARDGLPSLRVIHRPACRSAAR
jgi:hypothetical protein